MTEDYRNTPFGPEGRPWIDTLSKIAQDKNNKLLVSPPSGNPASVYAHLNLPSTLEQSSINSNDLEIVSKGLSEAQRNVAHKEILNYATQQTDNFLGYQTESTRLGFKEEIKPYLDMHLNNVGDPFFDGAFTANTKFAERMVLDYFASLWNNKWPSRPPYRDEKGKVHLMDPETYWGYVLTMGSTEGNLYGLFTAREYLSGQMLLNEYYETAGDDVDAEVSGASYYLSNPIIHETGHECETKSNFTPVALFSQDTHYSIVKGMRIMKIETAATLGRKLAPHECPYTEDGEWPDEIPSAKGTVDQPIGPGSVDPEAMLKAVEFFASRGYPVLMVLNYGSTFKGAYDDIPYITAKAREILAKHDMLEVRVQWGEQPEQYDMRDGYWVHVDGALGASYMPFVKMAYEAGKFDKKGPDFDFNNDMVHSLTCSGHKWPGMPWPSGVFMTRNKYMITPPDDPEYIGSPDTTFAGSRNAVSPLILWDFLSSNSYDDLMEKAIYCQNLAEYALQELKKVEAEIKDKYDIDIWVQRTDLSLSILLRLPNSEITQKYSLAEESVIVRVDENGNIDEKNGTKVKRTYAHMYLMWDVTRDLVDQLVEELRQPGAYDRDDNELSVVSRQGSASSALRKGLALPITGRSFR